MNWGAVKLPEGLAKALSERGVNLTEKQTVAAIAGAGTVRGAAAA